MYILLKKPNTLEQTGSQVLSEHYYDKQNVLGIDG
jgi:hypothetical protein